MSDKFKKPIILEKFLPYRLSYLTNMISQQLAGLYAEQYDITPHQWRILATLHRLPNSSAAQISARVAMDKVAVSRALKNLCEMGLVHKIFSAQDRRRSVLNLTGEGENIYGMIEPLVRAYEQSLLDFLDDDERSQLDHLLDKLTGHVTKG